MIKTIAKMERPEKHVSDINNSDNIGFLYVNNERKIIIQDSNNSYCFFNVTAGKMENVGTHKDRVSKKALSSYIRNNFEHNIKDIKNAETFPEILSWANYELPKTRPDVIIT